MRQIGKRWKKKYARAPFQCKSSRILFRLRLEMYVRIFATWMRKKSHICSHHTQTKRERRESEHICLKVNGRPVKFYSIASLHSEAVCSVRCSRTTGVTFGKMGFLCVSPIFYVHNATYRCIFTFTANSKNRRRFRNFHSVVRAISILAYRCVVSFYTRIASAIPKPPFWTLCKIFFIHTFRFYVSRYSHRVYTAIAALRFARSLRTQIILEGSCDGNEDFHCSCWQLYCHWHTFNALDSFVRNVWDFMNIHTNETYDRLPEKKRSKESNRFAGNNNWVWAWFKCEFEFIEWFIFKFIMLR